MVPVQELVTLNEAAYEQARGEVAGFRLIPGITWREVDYLKDNVRAYQRGDVVVIVYRGTASLDDVIYDVTAAARLDLLFARTGDVMDITRRVMQEHGVGKKIVLTGHSIGGFAALHTCHAIGANRFEAVHVFNPFVPTTALFNFHSNTFVYANRLDPVGITALIHYATGAWHSRRAKWKIVREPEDKSSVSAWINHSLSQWRLDLPSSVPRIDDGGNDFADEVPRIDDGGNDFADEVPRIYGGNDFADEVPRIYGFTDDGVPRIG